MTVVTFAADAAFCSVLVGLSREILHLRPTAPPHCTSPDLLSIIDLLRANVHVVDLRNLLGRLGRGRLGGIA